MKKFIITAILISLSLPAAAKDGTVSAAVGWNNSAGFQTSYDSSVKGALADLIERGENGYYNQWDHPTIYNTYIGAQNTTIGAQTIFHNSRLKDVIITTTNCGEVVSGSSVKSAGTTTITAKGGGCTVTTNNNPRYPNGN